MSSRAPYPGEVERAARLEACEAAFHSPDREIATEKITEGLFWEMRDLMREFVDRCERGEIRSRYTQEKFRAILAKLED